MSNVAAACSSMKMSVDVFCSSLSLFLVLFLFCSFSRFHASSSYTKRYYLPEDIIGLSWLNAFIHRHRHHRRRCRCWMLPVKFLCTFCVTTLNKLVAPKGWNTPSRLQTGCKKESFCTRSFMHSFISCSLLGRLCVCPSIFLSVDIQLCLWQPPTPTQRNKNAAFNFCFARTREPSLMILFRRINEEFKLKWWRRSKPSSSFF